MRRVLASIALIGWASCAYAQNPVVPNAPCSNDSTRIANTHFVHDCGGIIGPGTPGQLAVFLTPTTVGSSQSFDNGTSAGTNAIGQIQLTAGTSIGLTAATDIGLTAATGISLTDTGTTNGIVLIGPFLNFSGPSVSGTATATSLTAISSSTAGGGSMLLGAGSSNGSAIGGLLSLTSGNGLGTGAGGNITVTGGNGVASSGGNITLTGGTGGSTSGGDIFLLPGSGVSRNGQIRAALPTVDPAVAGSLWNNSGCVAVSGGTCAGAATGLIVGTTTVTGGTSPFLLYNNGGVLGNESFATLLASPPAIGGSTPAAGTFTALTTTGNTILGGTLTAASLTTSGTIANAICSTAGGLVISLSGTNCFASGGGSAGGSPTQVQFNNAGNLAGNANLTWVSPTLTIGVAGATTGSLTLGSAIAMGSITITPASSVSPYTATLQANTGTILENNVSQTVSATQTFNGTLNVSGIFELGGAAVTSSAVQLNFLNAATGTTGTTSGNLVFSNSPTLVTPSLGTPSAIVLTNGIGLPISTGVTGLGAGVETFLATPSSANLLAALTTKTGTGNAVFSIAPTITGAPTFTGVPILSGISIGTQVACLGLDGSNNVVKNSAACGSGGGGTPGGPTNAIQYNGGGVFSGSSVVNNAVVVTNGSGFPSESTTLPSGIAATNMALTTPALGVATATSINGLTITSTTGALTVASGKTLTDTSAVATDLLLGTSGGGFTAYGGTTCSSQVLTALGATGVGTCTTITNSFIGGLTTVGNANCGTLTATGTSTVGFIAVLSAPRSCTLPAASSMQPGQKITFLDIGTGTLPAINGANTVTLNRAGSDKIIGATSLVMTTPYGSITLQTDGVSNWGIPDNVGIPAPVANAILTTDGSSIAAWNTPGTGLAISAGTVSSSAIEHLSYQPGLLTAVNATKAAFHKVSKASTVDNIEGSAATFSCVSNPTITVFECGPSTTCASPTTIGTVTVTAAGTVVDGTVSSAAITAGDYVAFAMTAGTCASVDVAATVQTHTN